MCWSRSIANRFLLIIACACLWLGSQPASAQEAINFPKSSLVIETQNGAVAFEIELADTPERRARGYMFREIIPERTGMLFDFEQPRRVAMWMKNTPTSLDMLFIDREGTILHIFENTEPFSETVLASPFQVVSVFEVVAGTVEKEGIALGDKVRHAIFE